MNLCEPWAARPDGDFFGLPEISPDGQAEAVIRSRQLRILVVDDDAPFRKSLVYRLEALYDATVGEGDCGEGALAKASESFHLILMDINMPGSLDGLAACAEIRQLTLAIPIVLMTAQVTPELRKKAKELGVDLVSKPIDPEILERVLLAIIGG